MSAEIASFAAVIVPPGHPQKVTVPEDSLWIISSVSIVPTDPMPTSGRVVLYASILNDDGTQSEKIAIAPLRPGVVEVVNVDYEVNSVSPLVFSMSGTPISVNIIGSLQDLIHFSSNPSNKQFFFDWNCGNMFRVDQQYKGLQLTLSWGRGIYRQRSNRLRISFFLVYFTFSRAGDYRRVSVRRYCEISIGCVI